MRRCDRETDQTHPTISGPRFRQQPRASTHYDRFVTDQLWLCRKFGEPVWSVLAISLLFGIPADQIDPHGGLRQLSEAQQKQGRRRRREAQAATGSTTMVDTLRYWARIDLGLHVVDVDDEIRLIEPPQHL